MIITAEEFIRLRSSEEPEEYGRAAHDEASIQTWEEVIEKYPDYKKWVIHNKTVPIEILQRLAKDINPSIRAEVARKRKINEAIFQLLAADEDEGVRYALSCNTKLTIDKLPQIRKDGSEWFKNAVAERIKQKEIENKT
jgi:hypothetical protein